MAPPAVAREKLDAYGIEAVCADLADQKSLTQIAQEQEVSIGSLLTWIEADPDRSAITREVRSLMARHWDDKAERALMDAPDEFELKRAKEMAHHYRWRASKIRPSEYGDRQVIAGDKEAPLVGVSESDLDAKLAALLAKTAPKE